MQKSGKALTTALHVAIALSLAFMAVLVFGNVVLRYLFNSGITWSEEMSRFLFVWLVFLGAIGALKDNMHLGMDIVVNLLPRKGKKLVFVISNILVLYVLWLFLEGSWKMTLLNMDSKSPATGLPLAFMYGIGIITSISMAVIVLGNLWRVLSARDPQQPLTIIAQPDQPPTDSAQETEITDQSANRRSERVGG
ncbi:TRAP transporter small permease [Brevibacillus humidisoli]|uniref:TRAP transporter small permease n=1 Tax=Brevibacillus humidisoli TaxID=2895522 RepID=UPI001E2CBA7B|nr:TRAP transporter small permease [Brevibacillus humidisoli]UFJ40779.1 TRAP transporter small permease [Brevibacillus humidisoli]